MQRCSDRIRNQNATKEQKVSKLSTIAESQQIGQRKGRGRGKNNKNNKNNQNKTKSDRYQNEKCVEQGIVKCIISHIINYYLIFCL